MNAVGAPIRRPRGIIIYFIKISANSYEAYGFAVFLCK